MSAGRTEIHFHALPGIDDGPQTMADAIALARMAARDGTSRIVATPHVRDVVAAGIGILDELPERVRELGDELAAHGIEMELRVGGETDDIDVAALSDEELQMVAQGPEGERWLLYEPPWYRSGADYLEGAPRLRERGFGLIIPHPERSPVFQAPEGETALRLLHDAGDLVQVTAGSLLGRHGERAFSLARRWLAEGLVDLVSSDAHSPAKAPALSGAFEAVAKLAGPEEARRLVDDGPRAILDGGYRRTGA